MIDWAYVLRDGAILAAAASALIMGALRFNPRLFIRHFPDKLKERLPPLAPDEIRVGRIVGAALLTLLMLGPMASAILLVGREGPQPAHVLFLHAFIVGMISNLVDWLVLDELWLGLLKPRWALPPGGVFADFEPFDHGRHFRGFVTGTGLCAGVAAVVTAVLAAAAALG